ncbi:aquaporin [Pseudarthrobacter sp. NamE5]|uniref:aquaporin n=1 Tax=Pseudarthrobacter sp. NamE5 TaxID=2576839 RepID=UPI00110B9D2B|nr:aquaporin [Pseudarthrobacter sp. NamE5]TLM85109.1 porin [Pseudarthrobacter sp. NamE5]
MSTPAIDHSDALQPGTPADSRPGLLPRLAAEAFGSLFIVVAGLGVPLFTIPDSSPLPAALAAGLAVTAGMLAFSHVSGGHFNPAITVGHLLAGRIQAGAAAAYAAAQLGGGLAGALALFGVLRTLPGIADSRTAFDTVTAGFGEHSIIQAPLAAALLLEMLGAAIIVAVFLGTSGRAGARSREGVPGSGASVSHGAAAPVAVGLSFAVLLQLGQSVGNLPYNPARAVSSAVFSSGWALEQLWVFLAAPLVGAALAGLVFRSFGPGTDDVPGNTRPAAALEPNRSGGTDASPEAAGAPGHVHQGGDGSGRPGSEAQEFFEGKRG